MAVTANINDSNVYTRARSHPAYGRRRDGHGRAGRGAARRPGLTRPTVSPAGFGPGNLSGRTPVAELGAAFRRAARVFWPAAAAAAAAATGPPAHRAHLVLIAGLVFGVSSAASRNGLSFEDLVELKTEGVPKDYIGAMSDLFPDISLGQLLECHQAGLEPDYAEGMALALGEVDIAQLVEIHEAGVERDYAEGMASVFGEVDIAQLVEMHEAGVEAGLRRRRYGRSSPTWSRQP